MLMYFILQLEERKIRQPEEKHELRELWELFHSQERELHEMRIRLSKFMTKGAPVFLQPPKAEAKFTREKTKFNPHVHFSRSITNGSNEEQMDLEHMPDALNEVKSKIHKGRTEYRSARFEEADGQEVSPNVFQTEPAPSKKKSIKKPASGTRPKSSRATRNDTRTKSKKMSNSKTTGLAEENVRNELQMENEYGENTFENPSVEYDPHPAAESKHIPSNESEIGEGNDDTSKDFTSLSLATASASGAMQKQANPKISVTNDAP